jgi:hypothetical protein
MTTPCYSTRCPATTACMYVDNFDEYDGVGQLAMLHVRLQLLTAEMRHFAKLRLCVLPRVDLYIAINASTENAEIVLRMSQGAVRFAIWMGIRLLRLRPGFVSAQDQLVSQDRQKINTVSLAIIIVQHARTSAMRTT